MARPTKSAATRTGHMTDDEKNTRVHNEECLKGGSDQLLPPQYLSETQINIFNYILENLRESNILGNLDLFVLAQAAITIDRIQECEENINNRGMVDFDGKQNPCISIKNAYMKEFFRLCNELSLSPQSRAKLANMNFKAKEEATDPLLSVLGGVNDE